MDKLRKIFHKRSLRVQVVNGSIRRTSNLHLYAEYELQNQDCEIYRRHHQHWSLRVSSDGRGFRFEIFTSWD